MASAPNFFPASSVHLRLLVTRSKILGTACISLNQMFAFGFVEKSLSTFLFFSRCNKAVSIKRREERRLMILACWQCAWNEKVKNTHATHLARMTSSTQNRTCLLWNCKLFSFVERKSKDQVTCQTQVWLLQPSKKLSSKTFPTLKNFLWGGKFDESIFEIRSRNSFCNCLKTTVKPFEVLAIKNFPWKY